MNYGNCFNQYPQSSIQWVSGFEGAKAYQMQPNTSKVLLDNESNIFYIKTADNIGMCNIRVFDYEERNATVPQTNLETEITEMKKTIEELKTKIAEMEIDNEPTISTTKSKRN
jgi:hypothetical protein